MLETVQQWKPLNKNSSNPEPGLLLNEKKLGSLKKILNYVNGPRLVSVFFLFPVVLLTTKIIDHYKLIS